MTTKQLILNDGTTYNGSDCGYADGFLWCNIQDHRLSDVVITFLNPENTCHIVYQDPVEMLEYDGFTEVVVMLNNERGCAICLTKPTETGAV